MRRELSLDEACASPRSSSLSSCSPALRQRRQLPRSHLRWRAVEAMLWGQTAPLKSQPTRTLGGSVPLRQRAVMTTPCGAVATMAVSVSLWAIAPLEASAQEESAIAFPNATIGLVVMMGVAGAVGNVAPQGHACQTPPVARAAATAGRVAPTPVAEAAGVVRLPWCASLSRGNAVCLNVRGKPVAQMGVVGSVGPATLALSAPWAASAVVNPCARG